MKLQDIITNVMIDAEDDLIDAIGALEDGDYLAREGYTDSDEDAIGEAHRILVERKEKKIQEAMDELNADLMGGHYYYFADETQEWYKITEREMVELSELIHHDAPEIASNAYSHWCNSTGEEITKKEARELGLEPPTKEEVLSDNGFRPLTAAEVDAIRYDRENNELINAPGGTQFVDAHSGQEYFWDSFLTYHGKEVFELFDDQGEEVEEHFQAEVYCVGTLDEGVEISQDQELLYVWVM
jgi:hypothetical protein